MTEEKLFLNTLTFEYPKKPVKFYGRTGGVIPTPNEVYDCIVKLNKGGDL